MTAVQVSPAWSAARIRAVGRDGLDACVYEGTSAPVNKAPPTVTKAPRPLPGEEYETAKPPPVQETVDDPTPTTEEPETEVPTISTGSTNIAEPVTQEPTPEPVETPEPPPQEPQQ